MPLCEPVALSRKLARQAASSSGEGISEIAGPSFPASRKAWRASAIARRVPSASDAVRDRMNLWPLLHTLLPCAGSRERMPLRPSITARERERGDILVSDVAVSQPWALVDTPPRWSNSKLRCASGQTTVWLGASSGGRQARDEVSENRRRKSTACPAERARRGHSGRAGRWRGGSSATAACLRGSGGRR